MTSPSTAPVEGHLSLARELGYDPAALRRVYMGDAEWYVLRPGLRLPVGTVIRDTSWDGDGTTTSLPEDVIVLFAGSASGLPVLGAFEPMPTGIALRPLDLINRQPLA